VYVIEEEMIQITTNLKIKISYGQFSKLKEENNDDFNYFRQQITAAMKN